MGKPEDSSIQAMEDPQTSPPTTNDVTRASNENVVWWDSDSDPENPMNWTDTTRNTTCACLAFLSFVAPLGSSICAPGVTSIMIEFRNTSLVLATLVVSIYVLGFAFGPLLFAPLSELVGRLPAYHISNVGFVAFTVACALAPTLNTLVAFRFLEGFFGCVVLTNGSGTMMDMTPQEKRGRYVALVSIGPLLGPILGPVVGGFVADGLGWRWTFWILAILIGAVMIAMMLFMKESYAPIILDRKAEKLRKETGNMELRSKLGEGLTAGRLFWRSIARPLRLLALSPINLMVALYVAVVYGYIYLMLTTVSAVFRDNYGFSTKLTGLAYLGLGIGSMVGVCASSVASDKAVQRRQAEIEHEVELSSSTALGDTEKTTEVEPEVRLQFVLVGGFLLPIGFFFYGWVVYYHVHWFVPIFAMVFIGAGNMILFMGLVMYLVDSAGMYAASALAANSLIRSIAGAFLPLAGLPMFEALGFGWGNSVLGFIALVMAPIPFLLKKYGAWLRAKFDDKEKI
ncbi:putative cycloheximide resistance protein [Zalerion maritima]|uniref:Cycloheximide resistance protein n=1 Tax=Zalerion maritima TaxID=339359 RepID=A0AAD5WRI8_9PEZI|nr:putative cycloheximide resistance protein [Zalerion maritima]